MSLVEEDLENLQKRKHDDTVRRIRGQNRRITKFRLGSLETQEGDRIAQGIVDREKHEDNEVVSEATKKCR